MFLMIFFPFIAYYHAYPGITLLLSIAFVFWCCKIKNKMTLVILPLIAVIVLSIDMFNPILPIPHKIKKYYPAMLFCYAL